MDFAPGGNGSADEQEHSSNSGKGKKQYHRHSVEQIQQLEAFYKDYPHPDEHQRRQLSINLGLEPKQIKFWFQNKRTQTKNQNERADNNALRTENEQFHCENLGMREALRNLVCLKCESLSVGEETRQINLQRLRAENAWLKKEHERISNIVSTFSRRSGTLESFLSPTFRPLSNLAENIPGTSMNTFSPHKFPGIQEMEKSVTVEIAVNAMNELIELFRVNEPLWIRSSTNGRYILHRESYDKLYPKISHVNSSSAWIESSKDSGIVSITAMHLIDIFQDPKKWMEFFPTIVTKARTVEVLDTGKRGGSLLLMHEKLHVLSPLVAPRESMFLRYIRQLDSTTWVIVNISYDCFKEQEDASSSRSWKFPSGCIIQDMPNGKSNVTWVEHVQVDDKSLTDHLYKDLVCNSLAFGAKRWVVTLQSMCERFAYSMGQRTTPGHELEGVIGAPEGRRNLTKLSHKMIKNFFSSMQEKLDIPQLSELNSKGFRVSIRKSDTSAQPNGMIVFVATSLRLATSFENLFDFFKDEKARVQWDVLSEGNPIHEVAHISTGTHPGNSISLMQPFIPKENNMLILQESSIDPLGAFLIYAPVELSAITSAINGQDNSATTHVLPSGFIISSDGGFDGGIGASSSSSSTRGSNSSLLTLAFQIMVPSNTFSDQINMDSVATIHALINSTVQKIREAIVSKFE